MAIATRAEGTWASATTNATSLTVSIPTSPSTPQAGDLMVCVAAMKPFTAGISIDQGWSTLYTAASGSTSNGNGAGSQVHGVFYKVHTGSESNPTLTFDTNSSPALAVIVVLSKASNEAWALQQLDAPIETTASSLSFSNVTDAGINSGDWVFALVSAGDDSSTFTRTTTAISGGPTWSGNYAEWPATHGSTTTGNDAAADLGYRIASSTVSSGQTITVTGTLAASELAASSLFGIRVNSVTTQSGSFTASSAIKRTETGSFTASSVVKQTAIAGQFTADSVIKKTGIGGTLTAEAVLKKIVEGSFSAEATIASAIGTPTWVSPSNGSNISSQPTLEFTMPSSISNMYFHIQLDKVNTFNGGDLRDIKSHLSQTGWEYYNGSTWVAVPAGGVPNTYSGNNCRYTVQTPLSNGTWYRRVRVGN